MIYELRILFNRIEAIPSQKQQEIATKLSSLVDKSESSNGAPAIDGYPAEAKLLKAGIHLRYKDQNGTLYLIKPAPAFGNNPGHLYIIIDGEYYGKLRNRKFSWVKQPSPPRIQIINEMLESPKEMAMAYGKETGECSICGKRLTNTASIEAGIGPICASNL